MEKIRIGEQEFDDPESAELYRELQQMLSSVRVSEGFHERLAAKLDHASSLPEDFAEEDRDFLIGLADTPTPPESNVLSMDSRRGSRRGLPTWLQQWTPAVTMAALLVLAFAFWTNGPFAPEWARRPVGNGSLEVRGRKGNSISTPSPEKTLHGLVQEGLRQEDMEHIPQAVAAYQEAVNQVALPLNQLAWLAYRQGEAAKGLGWARLAVQLQPEKAGYLDTLAVILCTVGEQEEAIRAMEKAARLQPEKFGKKLERVRQGMCQ